MKCTQLSEKPFLHPNLVFLGETIFPALSLSLHTLLEMLNPKNLNRRYSASNVDIFYDHNLNQKLNDLRFQTKSQSLTKKEIP